VYTKRFSYFKRKLAIIDTVAVIGVFVFGIMYIIFEIETDSAYTIEIFELLWILCSMLHIMVPLSYLKRFKNIDTIFKLTFYACKTLGYY